VTQQWYIGKQFGSGVEIKSKTNDYCMTNNGWVLLTIINTVYVLYTVCGRQYCLNNSNIYYWQQIFEWNYPNPLRNKMQSGSAIPIWGSFRSRKTRLVNEYDDKAELGFKTNKNYILRAMDSYRTESLTRCNIFTKIVCRCVRNRCDSDPNSPDCSIRKNLIKIHSIVFECKWVIM